MHSKLKSLLALALIGVFSSSCTSEHIEIPANELYAREFIKKFGVIDSNHDYNMATIGSVNIIAPAPTDIKVFAIIDGKRYIFADCRNIKGKQNITFDIPRYVKEIIVRENHTDHTVPLGGTLNLSSTTASRQINENPDGSPVSFGRYTDDFREFKGSLITEFTNELPPEDRYNYKKCVADFSFISEEGKEMVFYPIEAKRANIQPSASNDTKPYYSHALGIYWLDENDKGKIRKENMLDIYYGYTGEIYHINNDFDKRCDRPIEIAPGRNYDNRTIFARGIKYQFNQSGIKYGFYLKIRVFKDDTNLSYLRPDPTTSKPKKFDCIHFTQASLNKTFGTTDGFVDDNGNPDYQTKIDEIIYGPENQKWVHSNKWSIEPPDERYDHVAAAFMPIESETGENHLFFSFEDNQKHRDSPNGGASTCAFSEFDLNDIIFMFDESTVPIVYDEIKKEYVTTSSTPIEPEYEEFEWLLAAEDLGGTHDFDFNDLVVSVKYSTIINGTTPQYTDVTITPLAAGGTLPIYLMYDGPLLDETEGTYVIGDECHRWLGSNSTSTPLNVHSSITHTCPEDKIVTLRVPGQFSVASHSNQSSWSSDNMGGFWLLVDPKEEFSGASHPFTIASSLPASSHKITCPKRGPENLAPQIICVDTRWEWTKEGCAIDETYHLFTNWLNSSSDKLEWYGSTEHHNSNVIPRK